ncbi:MAG: hypothetical protein HW380_655 [Magnetococcales bacterium]|nr:hypothetical protein [Magnetococcales bacterium]
MLPAYPTPGGEVSVGYSFPSARVFTKIRFYQGVYQANCGIIDYVVRRWNGTSWVQVNIVTASEGSEVTTGGAAKITALAAGWQTVTLADAPASTKIQLVFTSYTSNPAANYMCGVSDLQVWANQIGYNPVFIDVTTDGKVGLGIVAPSAKFDVSNGDTLAMKVLRSGTTATDYIASFHSDSASSGLVQTAIRVDGTIVSRNNVIASFSDPKLKENVVDVPADVFDRFLRIRFVNFNYIGDTLKQFGVLSTELKDQFPGLVELIPDFEELRDPDWTPGPNQTEANRPWKRIFLGTYTEAVKVSMIPLLASFCLQVEVGKRVALEAEVGALKARVDALKVCQ